MEDVKLDSQWIWWFWLGFGGAEDSDDAHEQMEKGVLEIQAEQFFLLKIKIFNRISLG